MRRPSVRKVARDEGGVATSLARSGSDPAGELVPEKEVAKDEVGPRTLFQNLVKAKRKLEQLAPKVQAANTEYDAAVKSIEDFLVDRELKSVGADNVKGYVVRVTLSEGENIKVMDREKVREWCEANMPDLLSVNTRTLQSWFKNEAPEDLQADPALLGVELVKYSRPQVICRPNVKK